MNKVRKLAVSTQSVGQGSPDDDLPMPRLWPHSGPPLAEAQCLRALHFARLPPSTGPLRRLLSPPVRPHFHGDYRPPPPSRVPSPSRPDGGLGPTSPILGALHDARGCRYTSFTSKLDLQSGFALQEAVFSSSVDEARATGVSRAGVGQTIAARWNETARFLADCTFSLLFPADCRICGDPLLQASRLPVCQACRDSVVPIQGNLCPICGERTVTFSRLEAEPEPCALCRRALPPYSRALAYGAFEDALRETIHLLKYDRVLPAANFLGQKLGTTLHQLPAPAGEGWLVMPVPVHKKKSRQRGFNQSELIARSALKIAPFAAKLNTACLVRQRETIPQAGLTRHERRKNIRGAFAVCHPAMVRGRGILLVDDVFTTGTTIAECARVLRQAGAASVYAVTVARALKEDRIGSKREGNSTRAWEAA